MVNEYNSNNGLESKVSKEQLREWEEKWKKFHRSLPDIVEDKNGVRLYKQDRNSGLYMLTPPKKPLRRRWYWPFG